MTFRPFRAPERQAPKGRHPSAQGSALGELAACREVRGAARRRLYEDFALELFASQKHECPPAALPPASTHTQSCTLEARLTSYTGPSEDLAGVHVNQHGIEDFDIQIQRLLFGATPTSGDGVYRERGEQWCAIV